MFHFRYGKVALSRVGISASFVSFSSRVCQRHWLSGGYKGVGDGNKDRKWPCSVFETNICCTFIQLYIQFYIIYAFWWSIFVATSNLEWYYREYETGLHPRLVHLCVFSPLFQHFYKTANHLISNGKYYLMFKIITI